ncbi:protein phosphatase methylesterase 1-like [Hylaeus volcanicus]|uniref:protein phosphatase methylesterase 1-like n=1 Tax=Hylaeus volcanicus TaxID=313075 RepID=UPI0023B86EBA|nr:protein phosphatase methylesterase 1-like [Hylaeus volcanicus]XP_053990609.1 protein phosphatase methylesterase 1-like [Hylaeus volcanicus]
MNTSDLWDNYFDRQFSVNILKETKGKDEHNKFQVYMGGSVHDTLLICFHGAGHTALSWSLLARSLKTAFCVAAYDCRGHGLTECDNSSDLSTETLVQDASQIIEKLQEMIFVERETTEKPKRSCSRALPSGTSQSELLVRERILAHSRRLSRAHIVLMGHSMGGAIAIHLASKGIVKDLQGLIILDVVEGTAIEALPRMEKFISTFPLFFTSLESAIQWSLKHVLHNEESARISIPSQLEYDGELWRWRVNLKETKCYWNQWFQGIGNKFLNAPIPSGGKVLILVGHERLDKPLTIAQMQGKFQLNVIPKSGHIVQEDQPEDIVQVVLAFAERYCLIN